MKKVKQQKKSPLDVLADSVAHDYAHQHTVTINSRCRVLEFEQNEVDRAIVALSAALANKRRQKANIAASLRGLAAVVAKR